MKRLVHIPNHRGLHIPKSSRDALEHWVQASAAAALRPRPRPIPNWNRKPTPAPDVAQPVGDPVLLDNPADHVTPGEEPNGLVSRQETPVDLAPPTPLVFVRKPSYRRKTHRSHRHGRVKSDVKKESATPGRRRIKKESATPERHRVKKEPATPSLRDFKKESLSPDFRRYDSDSSSPTSSERDSSPPPLPPPSSSRPSSTIPDTPPRPEIGKPFKRLFSTESPPRRPHSSLSRLTAGSSAPRRPMASLRRRRSPAGGIGDVDCDLSDSQAPLGSPFGM